MSRMISVLLSLVLGMSMTALCSGERAQISKCHASNLTVATAFVFLLSICITLDCLALHFLPGNSLVMPEVSIDNILIL